LGGGGYQPGTGAVVGTGVCTAGAAGPFGVASSDQVVSAVILTSEAVTSAVKDDNLFMKCSRLQWGVPVAAMLRGPDSECANHKPNTAAVSKKNCKIL
jgi:hypothetical protein